MDGETPLVQLSCAHCHKIFFVCLRHYRWQAYCTADCRYQSRLRIQRAANARHQKSEEGRLDHRDRQREYRARLRERFSRRVTYPGRQKLAFAIGCAAPADLKTAENVITDNDKRYCEGHGDDGEKRHQAARTPRCVVCGYRSEFILVTPWRRGKYRWWRRSVGLGRGPPVVAGVSRK